MIFPCLLVLGFIAAILLVALSPDFVPPSSADREDTVNERGGTETGEQEKTDPIWDATVDDLLTYLDETGFIDASTAQEMAADGLCSKTYLVNGAELYWWDLDTLEEDSEEFAAYQSLSEEGNIDLHGSGNVIAPVRNGPFALLTTRYEGSNVAELVETFQSFGK